MGVEKTGGQFSQEQSGRNDAQITKDKTKEREERFPELRPRSRRNIN